MVAAGVIDQLVPPTPFHNPPRVKNRQRIAGPAREKMSLMALIPKHNFPGKTPE